MKSAISQKEHQLLLDAIHDHAIFMIDADGLITSWNEGAKQLKGYEEHEVLGKHFRILFIPEDQAIGKPEKEMREALEKGKSEDDWWRLKKDGSQFWAHVVLTPIFDDNNVHIGFAKVTIDRTLQKNADELNKFLMNSVTDYAIFLLDRSGKILKFSKAAETILGYSESEVLGKSADIFFISDQKNFLNDQLHEALAKDSYEDEDWKQRRDGRQIWANFVVSPLHNRSGFVVMIKDLTNKKLFEQTSQTNIVLNSVNKELEQFAYVASHDLKEPVRKIATFCSQLQAETPKQHTLISKILKSCQRIQDLIEDILSYSTTSHNAPLQPHNLTDLLEAALDQLDGSIAEKQAEIKYGELPVVPVIPSQIEQLFQNLISNALKFCCHNNHSPVVNIDAVILPKSKINPKVLKKAIHCDEYVQITVKDNGIGFEQKYADQIFDLFQRLHLRTEIEGTGVGLAICKKVAENHGGSIAAFSEVGKGAEFMVVLPCR